MKIQTLEQAVNTNGVKCFIYGGAGVGKTPLILTIPGRGLVINAEAGLRSLLNRPCAGVFDVVAIHSLKELIEVHDHLESGKHEYEWVVIDSVSEIAEVLISDEKKKTADPRKAYGALIDKMSPMLKNFRDLPIDVIAIGKESMYKEEDTGRVRCEISIPGSKVGPQIPYLFDEVFYMFEHDDSGVTYLQTKRDKRVVARDRSGNLDPFEDASHEIGGLGRILAKIRAPKVITETTTQESTNV
jgi:phage nucleotide-binding protein